MVLMIELEEVFSRQLALGLLAIQHAVTLLSVWVVDSLECPSFSGGSLPSFS